MRVARPMIASAERLIWVERCSAARAPLRGNAVEGTAEASQRIDNAAEVTAAASQRIDNAGEVTAAMSQRMLGHEMGFVQECQSGSSWFE